MVGDAPRAPTIGATAGAAKVWAVWFFCSGEIGAPLGKASVYEKPILHTGVNAGALRVAAAVEGARVGAAATTSLVGSTSGAAIAGLLSVFGSGEIGAPPGHESVYDKPSLNTGANAGNLRLAATAEAAAAVA